MKIEPSGVVFVGVCDIQTDRCIARQSAPVTAVWETPGRIQVNVCRPCLEEKVRLGEWEIQGAKITKRADVAVYASDGQLKLVAEVKKSSDSGEAPRQWATQIHRNLLVHAGIPRAPYFLLALLPDRLYLWKESGEASFDREPDYEIDARTVLKKYFDLLSLPPEQMNEYQLEQAVAAWLEDIASSKQLDDASPDWLRESGLNEALRNGAVQLQIPIAA